MTDVISLKNDGVDLASIQKEADYLDEQEPEPVDEPADEQPEPEQSIQPPPMDAKEIRDRSAIVDQLLALKYSKYNAKYVTVYDFSNLDMLPTDELKRLHRRV